MGSLLYTTTVFSVKICILLFYLRIFPGTTIRRLIWATLVLNTICLAVFNIVTLTECRPISYSWQRWDGLHDGQCNNINAMAWAGAAISIIIDLWMLVLPLSQIIRLQIYWKRKLAGALMLGVGTLWVFFFSFLFIRKTNHGVQASRLSASSDFMLLWHLVIPSIPRVSYISPILA